MKKFNTSLSTSTLEPTQTCTQKHYLWSTEAIGSKRCVGNNRKCQNVKKKTTINPK